MGERNPVPKHQFPRRINSEPEYQNSLGEYSNPRKHSHRGKENWHDIEFGIFCKMDNDIRDYALEHCDYHTR